MPETILGVAVTPTVCTSNGLFYNHGQLPNPTPDLAAISAAVNSAAGVSVNSTLLQGLFPFFMGQYNPYVSEAIYSSTQTSDPSNGTNTVTTSLSPYYDGLFEQAFASWVGQTGVKSLLSSSNSNDWTTVMSDFQNYFATNPAAYAIRQKQENVLYWQFTYLLNLFAMLQNTVIRQADDPLKFADAMIVAQKCAAATTIPALKSSSVSNKVADPNSVNQQSQAQIALEKYNQGFNASSDRQRQAGTNLSFSQDALTQVNNANNTFWQTMGKLLNAVQNL